MKNQILPSILLTLCCSVFFGGVYTVVVWGIAQFAHNKGKGEIIQYSNNEKYGYANVGQSFTADKYFWSRPSAVSYNAAGSGGSNKGPSNPEYLTQVQARIDAFLSHNPGINKSDVPAELVTASGSGLDPNLSPKAALIQVSRIAKARGLNEDQIVNLVKENSEHSSLFGPATVNVLKLNIELDKMK